MQNAASSYGVVITVARDCVWLCFAQRWYVREKCVWSVTLRKRLANALPVIQGSQPAPIVWIDHTRYYNSHILSPRLATHRHVCLETKRARNTMDWFIPMNSANWPQIMWCWSMKKQNVIIALCFWWEFTEPLRLQWRIADVYRSRSSLLNVGTGQHVQ